MGEECFAEALSFLELELYAVGCSGVSNQAFGALPIYQPEVDRFCQLSIFFCDVLWFLLQHNSRGLAMEIFFCFESLKHHGAVSDRCPDAQLDLAVVSNDQDSVGIGRSETIPKWPAGDILQVGIRGTEPTGDGSHRLELRIDTAVGLELGEQRLGLAPFHLIRPVFKQDG